MITINLRNESNLSFLHSYFSEQNSPIRKKKEIQNSKPFPLPLPARTNYKLHREKTPATFKKDTQTWNSLALETRSTSKSGKLDISSSHLPQSSHPATIPSSSPPSCTILQGIYRMASGGRVGDSRSPTLCSTPLRCTFKRDRDRGGEGERVCR